MRVCEAKKEFCKYYTLKWAFRILGRKGHFKMKLNLSLRVNLLEIQGLVCIRGSSGRFIQRVKKLLTKTEKYLKLEKFLGKINRNNLKENEIIVLKMSLDFLSQAFFISSYTYTISFLFKTLFLIRTYVGTGIYT